MNNPQEQDKIELVASFDSSMIPGTFVCRVANMRINLCDGTILLMFKHMAI